MKEIPAGTDIGKGLISLPYHEALWGHFHPEYVRSIMHEEDWRRFKCNPDNSEKLKALESTISV
jgi:hypothetical protein